MMMMMMMEMMDNNNPIYTEPHMQSFSFNQVQCTVRNFPHFPLLYFDPGHVRHFHSLLQHLGLKISLVTRIRLYQIKHCEKEPIRYIQNFGLQSK